MKSFGNLFRSHDEIIRLTRRWYARREGTHAGSDDIENCCSDFWPREQLALRCDTEQPDLPLLNPSSASGAH